MICYKDTTFCPFHKNCDDGKTCSKALTEEVELDADMISLPICQFVDPPGCFKGSLVKSVIVHNQEDSSVVQ